MADQREPKLLYVGGAPIPICEACLDGEGGECHTAGCLFWINRAPDIPIRGHLIDIGADIGEVSHFVCPDCGLLPSPDGHHEGGCQCVICPECKGPTDRGPYSPCEACEIGPTATHEQLVAIYRKLPSDFEPYGKRPDEERGGDCSCGCLWFHELGRPSGDWGVCFNPESPRAGLLTFEHQGCPAFDCGPDEDEDDGDDEDVVTTTHPRFGESKPRHGE